MQNLVQTKSKSLFSKTFKSNIRNDKPNDRRDSLRSCDPNFNVDVSKTCLEIPPNKTPRNKDEKNKKDKKTSKIAAKTEAKISDSASETIATDDLTIEKAKKAQDAELNTYIRKTIRTTKLELDPRIIILQDRIAELEDRKKELKDKERALQSKISSLQEKQKQLENRNEELEAWSTEIEMHNLDVLEKTAEIEDKERLAEEKLKKAEEIRTEAHEKVKEAHEKVKEAQEIRTEAEEKDEKNQQMELELNTKVKELNSKERAVKQRSRKIEERTLNLVKREQTEIELRLALEEKQRFLLAKESGLLGREEFVLMEETNLKEKEAEVQIRTSEFEGRNSIIANKEKALKELEVSLRLSTTSTSNISSDNSLDKDNLGKTLENLSTYGVIDKNGKILVTGTGRCGTTFLMIIFTLLGLSTGFDKEKYHEAIFDNCNSGLEKYKITKHPKIFKNPQFLADIGDMTMNLKIIGCVIIPLRDYEAAAESRFKLGLGLANGLASDIPGGLWNATTVKEQIAYFNKIMANYVLQMVRWHIPTIFLDFDKMISSPEYLYNQLQPILNKISYDTFKVAYNKASDNQRKAILSPRT